MDGLDIWNALSKDLKSDRNEILHNIDDIWGSAALTVGDWKIVKGTNYNGQWDSWYGPAGDRNESSYDTNSVANSKVGQALKKLKRFPSMTEIR